MFLAYRICDKKNIGGIKCLKDLFSKKIMLSQMNNTGLPLHPKLKKTVLVLRFQTIFWIVP